MSDTTGAGSVIRVVRLQRARNLYEHDREQRASKLAQRML